jgi:hypothetical protein
MRWLKILIIFSLTLLLIFVLWKIVLPLFRSSDAFLKINTPGTDALVYLDGKKLGKSPYLGEKMRIGDFNLKLVTKLGAPFDKEVVFSTPITLTSQTLTAVNYEFGPNEQFSSGDIRAFRSGEGLTVKTSPSGANVWLDGELIGEAPVSLNPNHGVHKLKIIESAFFTRELEINVEEGLELVVEVYLAQNPFGEIKKLEEGSLIV